MRNGSAFIPFCANEHYFWNQDVQTDKRKYQGTFLKMCWFVLCYRDTALSQQLKSMTEFVTILPPERQWNTATVFLQWNSRMSSRPLYTIAFNVGCHWKRMKKKSNRYVNHWLKNTFCSPVPWISIAKSHHSTSLLRFLFAYLFSWA